MKVTIYLLAVVLLAGFLALPASGADTNTTDTNTTTTTTTEASTSTSTTSTTAKTVNRKHFTIKDVHYKIVRKIHVNKKKSG
ncbi:hypothetical protein KR018_003660 [Drosophila ironensis]|nr:hypothetical protein KR018_003660 [Drosophila ironensis]